MAASTTVVLPADAGGILRAAEALRAGGLVAFPTETVYGLGVHALDRAAVRRLFAAKGRPAHDPLIVHVATFAQVLPLVREVPESARRLAERFWPGPLTLVLPRSPQVPDEVTAGLDTVAIRIPVHPVARRLLEAAAIPVAAPSANLFSRPSPTRAEHVRADLDGRIDLIVDGGATTVGVESTVLDLSEALPRVLRPGAISSEMLSEVIGHVAWRSVNALTDAPMRSPGQLEKHYSPRAPLTLYEGPHAIDAMVGDAAAAIARGERVGILAAAEDLEHFASLGAARVTPVGSIADSHGVARGLYDALRELDAAPLDVILARAFPADTALGVAIRDRLGRAAAGRIVRTS